MQADVEKAAVVPRLVRQVEAMRRRYDDRWEKKLPKQKDLHDFIKKISSFRDTEGLNGQIIEPGNPRRQELFHTLPVTLRFEGSFMSLAGFLDRLDKMERLSRVQRLDIVANTNQSPANLAVDMRLNIYYSDAAG